MLRLTTLTISTLSLTLLSAEEFPVWVAAHADFIAGYQQDGSLPRHAHDPQQDLYAQGLEMSLSFQPTEYFSGFFNLNAFQTEDGMDAEWEEGFVKFTDPSYGFELRAGRYLNRIGTQNNIHLHSWDFVDANLSTVYFLGDEGLVSEGAELSWSTEFDRGLFAISASYGQIVAHDHGHDEEGHDDHDDDHDDDDHDEDHDDDDHDEDHDEDDHDDDHDEDDHDDDHDEDDHDDDHDDDHEDEDDHDDDHEDEDDHDDHSDEGGFSDEVFSLRAMVQYNFTDQHQNTLGLNYVKSVGGNDEALYGADYTYTWRANGLEAGGQYVSLTGEYFAYDNGDDIQNSFMLSSTYGLGNGFSLGARYEWIEFPGELDHGMEEMYERQRLSTALTYTHIFNEDWRGRARLQYNQDWADGSDDRSGTWFQVGFSYGGNEVR